jgi:hypothetical protein
MERLSPLTHRDMTVHGGAANVAATTLTKKYKGILHKDSLRWCHGTYGLEHVKQRRFRYPFYKYVQIHEVRVVVCICKNCNMLFWGKEAEGVPLVIPVYKHPTAYFYYKIPVSVNGEILTFSEMKPRETNLGWATQEMINEDTRRFIEKVQ